MIPPKIGLGEFRRYSAEFAESPVRLKSLSKQSIFLSSGTYLNARTSFQCVYSTTEVVF